MLPVKAENRVSPVRVDAPTLEAPRISPQIRADQLVDLERSGFDRKPEPRTRPGAFRGSADSEIGRLVSDMTNRLRRVSVLIDGETPLSIFSRAILENRRVTNEQILAMRVSTVEQMADTPDEQARALRKYPDVRQSDVHRFTVALFAAAMAVEPEVISAAAPSLGLTGAPNRMLLRMARRPTVQLNTALHDLTEHMRARASVRGLNKAVWGVEGGVISALCVPLNIRRF